MDKSKKIIFILLVFILGVSALYYIYSKKLNSPVIRSDGEGYYAYLPAILIYRDVSLRAVVNGPLLHKAPQGASLWRNTGRYFIKYPIGEAILISPFFVIGYGVAHLKDANLNGYSPPFQYMAAFSGLFYGVLGLFILWMVLQRYFKSNTILLSLTALLFGTNLFHYATYDNIFSHIYSFFLFALFLLFVERIYRSSTFFDFIVLGLVGGLILITRPTNGLWLIFAFLFGIHSFQDFKERLKFWKLNWVKCLFALLALLGVVSIQFAYWKAITGSFLFYSYENESLNFDKPEILNVLFSVKKGLFFWAPLLLTVFPGIFFVRKMAKGYFLPILVFFPLNIYVISSWHTWTYGGSFGQRPFTESIPMFAIALCSLYEGLPSARWRRVVIGVIIVTCILSIWLMFKYWVGLIPYNDTTWDYFISTFFTIRIP